MNSCYFFQLETKDNFERLGEKEVRKIMKIKKAKGKKESQVSENLH